MMIGNEQRDSLNYKARLVEIIDKYQLGNRFNLTGLYLELEKTAAPFLRSGMMDDGERLPIPTENGNILEMKFYRKYSTLNQISENRTTRLVGSEDSFKREYNALYAVEDALKASGLGVGYAFPKRLPSYLKSIKEGEIVVAGKDSLVCTANLGNALVFAKHSFKGETPKISELSNAEEVTVLPDNPLSVQEFYRNTRNRVTDSAEYRLETLTTAQQLVNKLFAGCGTKKVKIGPNNFYAQKDGGKLRYFDEGGEEIPEAKLKVLVAWLNKAPVITEYRQTKSSTIDFEDKALSWEVENLLNSKRYSDAYTLLVRYQNAREDDRPITFKSYIKNGDDYKAVSFTFKKVDGECQVYKSEFENDDFTGRSSFVKVSPADFREFCNQKYEEDYTLMISKHKEEVLKTYPNCQGELASKIAEEMLRRENTSIFKSSSVSYSDEKDEALLDAYEDR